MGEPIRVLHILQRMEAGGTQALLMNIYRKIDRTKVQFDFLVVYKEKQFYDDEIEKMYYTKIDPMMNCGVDPKLLTGEKMLRKGGGYRHTAVAGYRHHTSV